MLIPSAQPYHMATYTVNASNYTGEAKMMANLIVKAPTPAPPTPLPVIQITEPPVFTQIFGDADLELGDQLKLECCIAGKPYPTVRDGFGHSQCVRQEI